MVSHHGNASSGRYVDAGKEGEAAVTGGVGLSSGGGALATVVIGAAKVVLFLDTTARIADPGPKRWGFRA